MRWEDWLCMALSSAPAAAEVVEGVVSTVVLDAGTICCCSTYRLCNTLAADSRYICCNCCIRVIKQSWSTDGGHISPPAFCWLVGNWVDNALSVDAGAVHASEVCWLQSVDGIWAEAGANAPYLFDVQYTSDECTSDVPPSLPADEMYMLSVCVHGCCEGRQSVCGIAANSCDNQFINCDATCSGKLHDSTSWRNCAKAPAPESACPLADDGRLDGTGTKTAEVVGCCTNAGFNDDPHCWDWDDECQRWWGTLVTAAAHCDSCCCCRLDVDASPVRVTLPVSSQTSLHSSQHAEWSSIIPLDHTNNI